MTPPPGDPGPLERIENYLAKLAKLGADGLRKAAAAAAAAMKRAQPWPANKLDAIKKFSQDRMATLYSPKIAAEIRRVKSERGLRWAEEDTPQEVAKAMERTKRLMSGDGKVPTDAEVRAQVIEWRTFDSKAPHEELSILHARGLAGDPVVFDRANTGGWSPDPNQAINAIIPDKPGTYVFAVGWAGLPVSGDLEVLVVEKRPDGSSSVSAGGSFVDSRPDVKSALNVPVLDLNPSRDGSRAVLVYPLNPTASGGKK